MPWTWYKQVTYLPHLRCSHSNDDWLSAWQPELIRTWQHSLKLDSFIYNYMSLKSMWISAVCGLQMSSWLTVDGLFPDVCSRAAQTGELRQFIHQIRCVVTSFFIAFPLPVRLALVVLFICLKAIQSLLSSMLTWLCVCVSALLMLPSLDGVWL